MTTPKTDTPRRHSAVTTLREILIQECREKESIDPRETDVNDSFHASITLSIGEIRRFLIATAVSSDELDLPLDHPHYEKSSGAILARKAAEYAALEQSNAELRKALEVPRITLTTREIFDLAKAANLIPHKAKLADSQMSDEDEETEYTVFGGDEGVMVKDDDNTPHTYPHGAFLTEYPDEGTFPLGAALRGKEQE